MTPHSPAGAFAHKDSASPLLTLSEKYGRQDLLLRRAMLTGLLLTYVDRFARAWHRLSTADAPEPRFYYRPRRARRSPNPRRASSISILNKTMPILIITGWEVAIRECEWSRKRPHSVLMPDTGQMWVKQQIAKRKPGVAPTELQFAPNRTCFAPKCTQYKTKGLSQNDSQVLY